MKYFFQNHRPGSTQSRLTPPVPGQCAALPYNCQLCESVATRRGPLCDLTPNTLLVNTPAQDQPNGKGHCNYITISHVSQGTAGLLVVVEGRAKPCG